MEELLESTSQAVPQLAELLLREVVSSKERASSPEVLLVAEMASRILYSLETWASIRRKIQLEISLAHTVRSAR